MSGVINEIEGLIMAHATGSDWLAALTGGLWPPDSIPECAPGGGPYAEFSWVGFKPDHTFSENNNDAAIQFLIHDDNRTLVNELIDGCIELFGIRPKNRNTVDTDKFQMEEENTIPAMKSDEKDRFSRFIGMVEFRFKFTKTC